VDSYGRVRRQKARAITKTYWTAHQAIAWFTPGIVSLLAALIIRQFWPALERLDNVTTALFVVFVVVLAYVVSVLGSYVFNYIWSAPAALHEQQQVQIRKLTTALPASVEKHRLDTAKAAVEKHGTDAVIILRHLRAVGKITFAYPDTPNLPSGMDKDQATKVLKALKVDSIVEEETIAPPYERSEVGGQAGALFAKMQRSANTKHIWQIIPQMESAVDALLNE
jgi:hypothetical protein